MITIRILSRPAGKGWHVRNRLGSFSRAERDKTALTAARLQAQIFLSRWNAAEPWTDFRIEETRS